MKTNEKVAIGIVGILAIGGIYLIWKKSKSGGIGTVMPIINFEATSDPNVIKMSGLLNGNTESTSSINIGTNSNINKVSFSNNSGFTWQVKDNKVLEIVILDTKGAKYGNKTLDFNNISLPYTLSSY